MFQTASKAKKRPKRKTLKSVRKWISPEKNFPREGKCVFLSLGKRKCVFLSLEKRKCVFLSLGKFFSWHFWGVFCMKRAGVGVACVSSTKMWGEVFSWARIETWPARREFHLKWKKVTSLQHCERSELRTVEMYMNFWRENSNCFRLLRPRKTPLTVKI